MWAAVVVRSCGYLAALLLVIAAGCADDQPEAAGSAKAKPRGSVYTYGTPVDVDLGSLHTAAPTSSAAPPSLPSASSKRAPQRWRGPLENPFIDAESDPTSTFGIDVDTASYTLVRSQLKAGMLPLPAQVRVEEMLNYFRYSYPSPPGRAFGFMVDTARAPWAPERRVVRLGIKGPEIADAARPPSNLVLLVDVSGSMLGPDKLGLLKQGFALMIDKLDERDTVSIVTYAGRSGVALPPTKGNRRAVILTALESLEPGGGTNGSQGIQTAYRLAAESFVQGGTNRVLVATDGDFNMGMTSRADLQALVERMAATGVYLTMLGFGRGNPADRTMELLADRGNGNYAFIDSAAEARRFLSRELTGTLVTVAKDVKIQITWDPREVRSHRLIGYENRQLADRDFSDDGKDGGEIGAGHTVTALYDIEPTGAATEGARLGKVAIRFKAPDGDESRLVEADILGGDEAITEVSTDFRFATAVAAFGMLLRGSPHVGRFTLDDVEVLAGEAIGDDPEGERSELVAVVKRAKARRLAAMSALLARRSAQAEPR